MHTDRPRRCWTRRWWRCSSEDASVGIPMRCVFALTAMGFLPQSAIAARAGTGPRHRRRRRDRPGACFARLAAHRRTLRLGVPPTRRPRAGLALTVPARATVSARRHAAWRTFCGRSPENSDQPGGGVRRQLAVHQRAAGQQHLAPGQGHRAAARVQRAHQSAASAGTPGRRCGESSHSIADTAEFWPAAPQFDRPPEERQRGVRFRRAAFRPSASPTPAGSAARCRDWRRTRTAVRRRPTASAPGRRRGRAWCARSVPTPGRAAPRRAARRSAGRVPRRCR